MTDTTTDLFAEDETFPFVGYWKGTVKMLIDGDGIRLSPDLNGECLQVYAAEPKGEQVTLAVGSRTAHVARVLADALHRPIEGMSSDEALGVITLPADTTVWVRL